MSTRMKLESTNDAASMCIDHGCGGRPGPHQYADGVDISAVGRLISFTRVFDLEPTSP